MSRHKFVRDLDYDDYCDEIYDDDDHDVDHGAAQPSSSPAKFVDIPRSADNTFGVVSQKKLSQSQQKAMRNAMARVKEIVGDLDPNEIRIALEQSDLDISAAAAMLLDAAESSSVPVWQSPDSSSDWKCAEKDVAVAADPEVAQRSLPDDRPLFEDVQIGTPSVPEQISTTNSLLAQSLSAQLDLKTVASLPPAPSKPYDMGITPFAFDVPSPDTVAQTVHLKAAHTVAVVSTPKRASSPKPAAQHKGLSEAALKKRKERIQAVCEQQQKNPNQNISLIVAGHVDAGKSTLMGHLLYLLGAVSSRDMHKFEKESREQGKSSFKYAWVLDTGEDERSHGITVDVATKHFSTDHRQVALLDAPGHRDYVPNMIAGASQADCALLVVDAVTGEFESGFEENGQTKEHAVLLKSFGIGEIVVVINKLDMMEWSHSRYQDIVNVIDAFLKNIGFRSASIRYIPCSGLEGHNLFNGKLPAALASWYKGPTLLEMIDTFSVPKRHIEAPFRAVCSDIFKSQALSGISVAASVLQGCLFDKDKVLLLPANQLVSVKGILLDGGSVDVALPGQRVDIGLTGVSEESVILIGSILSDIQEPLEMASCIHATIVTLDSMMRPILPGSQLVLHAQSMEEPCTVTRLRALVHKATGEVTKRHPRLLTASQRANVVISLNRPIGLEPIDTSRQLGRFSLRREGRTVAVGVVKSVNKQ